MRAGQGAHVERCEQKGGDVRNPQQTLTPRVGRAGPGKDELRAEQGENEMGSGTGRGRARREEARHDRSKQPNF